MIKFTASGSGRTIVGLGLEPENIRRLQAGQPIRVALSDLGFAGAVGAVQLFIFTGTSAADMRAQLQPFISADTVVHEEPSS